MKLTPSQLQAALNSLVAANNRARIAQNKIYAHCEAVYGHTPGDIDNDTYIDSCESGCGSSCGMTVEEFHDSMVRCIDRLLK